MNGFTVPQRNVTMNMVKHFIELQVLYPITNLYDELNGFSKTYTCQAIAVYNEAEKQFGFLLNEEGVPEFFNWGDIMVYDDFSIVGNIWDNPEIVKVRLNEYFKT